MLTPSDQVNELNAIPHVGSLKDAILSEALRLGFVAAGVAAAGPVEHEAEYARWLAQGFDAGMAYLRRHEAMRRDLRQMEPGARSIVVVAAAYPVEKPAGCEISCYAQGRDYHDLLKEHLQVLGDFIAARAPLKLRRVCVDSAPLAEREWALRAGIGWRGRNGQVIIPGAGACVVLGELLLDIELAADIPMASRCGACRQCIEACPTVALQEDGCVDARRCRSYLTIEHKGEFSPEQEEWIGGCLFGCDACTVVCPHNAVIGRRVLPGLLAAAPLPDAAGFLRMDRTQFKQRLAGTSMERTGLERLQRNARVSCDFSGSGGGKEIHPPRS